MLDLILYLIQGKKFQMQDLEFFSRSSSRPRFGGFNQPLDCYYCQWIGHTANNCFHVRIENFLEDNIIKVGEIISEILDDIQITGEMILETDLIMVPNSELISQLPLCIQIYRQGIGINLAFPIFPYVRMAHTHKCT